MRNRTIIASSILSLAAVVAAFASSPASIEPAPAATALVVEDQVGSRAYLHSFNLPAHGVAIEGYSPVSYFEGRAERGNALFAVERDGVTYHLTDAQQVATFRADPTKFVPAFGGWCAFGMAVSDKFPVDPTNFQIVDGKLFLFLRNAGVDARELWNDGNEAELLPKARAHWKKVQG